LTIACDIQDTVTAGDAYRQDFIAYADILFFSAVNQADPTALIETFLAARSGQSRPDRIVISGMGARGCAVGSRQGVEFFPPVEMDTPVIDTNGAGDSLAVGFLTSFVLDGYSLHDSVLRGQIAARHTCTLKASSSHLITRAQLDQLFQARRAYARAAP
jgi:sugar/nucleoside kinase (ribokinase family)